MAQLDLGRTPLGVDDERAGGVAGQAVLAVDLQLVDLVDERQVGDQRGQRDGPAVDRAAGAGVPRVQRDAGVAEAVAADAGDDGVVEEAVVQRALQRGRGGGAEARGLLLRLVHHHQRLLVQRLPGLADLDERDGGALGERGGRGVEGGVRRRAQVGRGGRLGARGGVERGRRGGERGRGGGGGGEEGGEVG